MKNRSLTNLNLNSSQDWSVGGSGCSKVVEAYRWVDKNLCMLSLEYILCKFIEVHSEICVKQTCCKVDTSLKYI